MIKIAIFICLALASMAWAGYVTTTKIPNGGFITTKFGTGYIVFASTPMGSAPVTGTQGQCIGILCGTTYAN